MRNTFARDPDPKRQQAQLFTALTFNVNLPARARAKATTDCTLREDLNLFNFGGHAHEWGTHVKVERIRAGGTDLELLYSKDWHPEFQSNPPLDTFAVDKPLAFKKGDVLRVTCEYMNSEDKQITFPREMCVAFGFYFPATKDIQCIDDKWIVP